MCVLFVIIFEDTMNIKLTLLAHRHNNSFGQECFPPIVRVHYKLPSPEFWQLVMHQAFSLL